MDFRHGCPLAQAYGSQGLAVSRHILTRTRRCRKSLNPNRLRQFRADAQARIANLADETGLPGNEFDLLFLTETQFAKPVGHFGIRRKLLNANRSALFDPAQRANLRSGTAAFEDTILSYRLRFHRGQRRLIETGLQEGFGGIASDLLSALKFLSLARLRISSQFTVAFLTKNASPATKYFI